MLSLALTSSAPWGQSSRTLKSFASCSGTAWDHRAPVGKLQQYTPLARRMQTSWTAFSRCMKTSLMNLEDCCWLGVVTTIYTCFQGQRQWLCDCTGIRNSRRMNLRAIINPCCRKESSSRGRVQPYSLRLSWVKNVFFFFD